ncbi:MAG: ABC transporter permease subunit, partial [Pseudomonadota bacterium]|nr:ABC transporter permease subunit [Pseudomonadota bacterium]
MDRTRKTDRSSKMGRFNRWDTPWLNPLLVCGVAIIFVILAMGLAGQFFWDTDLAYTGSAPLNLPPYGFEGLRGKQGMLAHPLGTENSGRDMLALMLVGAPNTLLIGIIAASLGMGVGVILGFSSGYLGGRLDDIIRLFADVTITIPALMILVVINALLRQIDIMTMALLIALFIWASPTRLIRSQVLT